MTEQQIRASLKVQWTLLAAESSPIERALIGREITRLLRYLHQLESEETA